MVRGVEMHDYLERVKQENGFTGKESQKEILWFLVGQVIELNKNVGKISERSKTNRKLVYGCYAFVIIVITLIVRYFVR